MNKLSTMMSSIFKAEYPIITQYSFCFTKSQLKVKIYFIYGFIFFVIYIVFKKKLLPCIVKEKKKLSKNKSRSVTKKCPKFAN